MRLSRYFLPVLKEAPADAQIVSHQLMLRAGMIKQNGAGIYSWLPLGMRVLHKIEKIVREEQERAGAIELLMPTIQSCRSVARDPAATTLTARRCSASPTATSARCFTARRTRR